MKVKDLIAILQTMPQDVIVTSYSAHEETTEVTKKFVRFYEKGMFYNKNRKFVEKAHVDIMGDL